jgi:hypothetical protein
MPESIAATENKPHQSGERRKEGNFIPKSRDLGIPSESSDEVVTDSDIVHNLSGTPRKDRRPWH